MNKIKIHPLGLVTLTCLGLSGVRVIWQQEGSLLFLIWNLFLAFLPYALSLRLNAKKWHSLVFFGLSVAFLPNAAYLLTDFIHFRLSLSTPTVWYDLILFFAYSMAGLLFTSFTINHLTRYLTNTFGPRLKNLFSILVFPAIGFGIYLGRVERYNSWDPLIHPFTFVKEIVHLLTGTDAPNALQFAGLFAIFSGVTHVIINNLIKKEDMDGIS